VRRTYGDTARTGRHAVRPDAVIVATPNASHVADGLACVVRGIPAGY